MFFLFEEFKKGDWISMYPVFKQKERNTPPNWAARFTKIKCFFEAYKRRERGWCGRRRGRANSVEVHVGKLGVCVFRGGLALLWLARSGLRALLSVHRAILFGRRLLLWRLHFGLGFGDDVIASRIQLLYNDEHG